jgi:hypothetical protein
MNTLNLGASETDFFHLQQALSVWDLIQAFVYKTFAQITQFVIKIFVNKNSNVPEKTLKYCYRIFLHIDWKGLSQTKYM